MSFKLRFLRNVLWNWADVALSIFSGFILARVIIRRLGDENFGIWTLTMSMVEYYWLLDLGLRGATIKYAAHYRATGETRKINEVINTGMVFSILLIPVVIAITVIMAPRVAAKFPVSQPSLFAKLIVLVVSSWLVGSLANLFGGVLEGFQRFDYTSQTAIISNAARNLTVIVLLYMGYGVLEMAYVTFAAQVLIVCLTIFNVRRAFPEHRFSLEMATMAMYRQLMGFGVHSIFASIGQRILNQSTPLLLGWMQSAKATGYFNAPSRLVEYTAEAISRVGMVSNSNAAEMLAQGKKRDIESMGIDTNRYCLSLYLPLTVFFVIYGDDLLALWISREFAAKCSGVLPALVIGTTLGPVAHYNSVSILFGMGRHQRISRAMMAEALLGVAGAILVIPVFGLAGAAWVKSILTFLNRGLLAAYLLSMELETSYLRFLFRVYGPPLAVAVPVAALLAWLHMWMPGNHLPQLIAAGILCAVSYYALAYRFCLRQHHQDAFRRAVLSRLPAGVSIPGVSIL